MDASPRRTYVEGMRLALRLLLFMVLAAFAASAGGGVSGASAGMAAAAGADQSGMGMADCEACPTGHMAAEAGACGTVCMSPAVVVLDVQVYLPPTVPAQAFGFADHDFAGLGRLPELTPPR